MLIGTGISAYSAYAQGKAAQQEAENAAIISEYNAQVSEREAAAIDRAATKRDEILQRQGAEFQAKQRAMYGRTGVTMSGSPLTVLATTAEVMDQDLLTELAEYDLRAGQARSQAVGQRLQGKSYTSLAKSAGRGAILSGVGTAFGGLSSASAYKTRYDYMTKLS